jgi:hypothetical protein
MPNLDAGPVTKNPLDVENYAMEFGQQPEISDGAETPTGSPTCTYVSIPPGDTSLILGAAAYGATPFTAQQVIVRGSGGKNGFTYILTFVMPFASGGQRALTGAIICADGTT